MLTHADKSASVVKPHPIPFQAMPTRTDDLRNTLIERVRESNMRHYTSFKESERPDALGPVDNLIGDHEVPRLDFLPQTSHSREGHDASDSNGTEGSDVGARRHFVRGELMMEAMAAQERDRDDFPALGAGVMENSDRG